MGKQVVLESVNVSRLDLINASGSVSFKDMPPRTPVSGVAIVEDDGVKYSYIFNGTDVYAGNSATIRQSVEAVIELLTESPETQLYATVQTRSSANEREFLVIRFSE